MKKILFLCTFLTLNTFSHASMTPETFEIIAYEDLDSIEVVSGPSTLNIHGVFSQISLGDSDPDADDSEFTTPIPAALIISKLPGLRHVNICDMHLTKQEWDSLASALQNTSISNLRFLSCFVSDSDGDGDHDISYVFPLIGSILTLKSVSIVNCGLSSCHTDELATELLKLTSLTALDIIDNSIDLIGLSTLLAPLIPILPQLTRLAIVDKESSHSCDAIVPFLKSMVNVNVLCLSRGALTPALIQNITAYSALTQLSLYHCSITSRENAMLLAQLFIALKSIGCRKLTLYNLVFDSDIKYTINELITAGSIKTRRGFDAIYPYHHYYYGDNIHYIHSLQLIIKRFMPSDFELVIARR